MRSLIAGIDLGGSKITVAYFNQSGLHALSHNESMAKKASRAHRLYEAVSLTTTFHLWNETKYFFIEEPLIGRGVRASLQIAQCAGALLHEIGMHGNGDNSMLVPVGEWKKKIVGKGNADKSYVADWLKANEYEYYERCNGNQDLIDATCIGLYGTKIVEVTRSLSFS